MNNKETIEYRKKWVNCYKMVNGCCLCGYNKHPSALCFDHMNQEEKHEITKNGYSKRSNAGGMFMLYGKKYSTDILINEIKKCRIVCHNCHMEQTHSKCDVKKNTYFKNFTIKDLEIQLNKND